MTYRYQFQDGGSASFSIKPASPPAEAELPGWTELGFHQCPNCPLSAEAAPHCPMAVAFIPLIEAFGKRLSYDTVTVQVESSERTVSKTTSLQQAVGSLMGLLAATCACPRTDFLKPMARFHLPFANEQETIYRVASMYLLVQYFERGRGREPDWELKKLHTNYEELQTVNAAMAARLRTITEKDSTLNALVILDLLAKALPYSINDMLEDVRGAFE
ncbi:MAG TPA: hypothetical protein VEC35_11115 [Noviherbaspirillum sp.]|nr:hypothetical protein [Noviherbaspirillum sp.]